MEKRNTVLLTVIAIATLLVAVVGATFAYFSANVTVTKNDNNGVNVKAAALASATITLGEEVTTAEQNIYPGAKWAREITVKGNCPDGQTCEGVNATLVINGTDEESKFGNDVKYTLYQMTDKTANVSYVNTPNTSTVGKYSTTATLGEGAVDPTDTTKASVVKTGTLADLNSGKLYDYNFGGKITGDTDVKYYLVVEYVNHEDTTTEGENPTTTSGSQNDQQGKSFTISMHVDY